MKITRATTIYSSNFAVHGCWLTPRRFRIYAFLQRFPGIDRSCSVLRKPPRLPASDERLRPSTFDFEVVETPGHCPGHMCLFERNKKWLFSGDLYVAAELDSQLRDADGPRWIASLESVLKLSLEWMFDAHGSIFAGADVVARQLQRKLDFLTAIRDRVNRYATHCQSIQQLTRRVFDKRDLVDWLSFGDGWLSLITGSDFCAATSCGRFCEKLRDKLCKPILIIPQMGACWKGVRG